MKHGLIFFAALVAVALVVSPAAWADTKQVDSLSNTTTDAGADIAVGANGDIYVSAKVSAQQLQVQKGTNGGTFTDFLPATVVDTNSTAASVSTQRTAIALYGPTDSPIVAIDSVIAGPGGGTDTSRGIAIYVNDTGTSTMRRLTTVDLRGASLETQTQRITAFDLLANDSYVILCVNYGSPSSASGSVRQADTLALFIWRVAGNGAALASLEYTRYVLDTDPGLGADLQIAEGPAGGLKVATDTAFRFYVMLNVTEDTEANAGEGVTIEDRDTGISVYRVTLADSSSGGPGLWSAKLRFSSSRYGVISAGGGDTFVDAAMALDQEDAGDTIDRVTIIVSPHTQQKGADTLFILVIDDDSASIPPANSNAGDSAANGSPFQWSDTFSQLDTGLANVAQTVAARPASLAFNRSGNALTLYYISNAGNLYKATASLDATSRGYDTSFAASISWSVDTLNQNLGYAHNDPVMDIAANLPNTRSYLELSQTVVNNVLYVVGHDRTSGRIWYVTSSAAAESKKKESAVCLMDRLLGKTGLRAAFPALKTFRDTLLGTDLGRKAVSLYYGF